jgi:hypothetical protein
MGSSKYSRIRRCRYNRSKRTAWICEAGHPKSCRTVSVKIDFTRYGERRKTWCQGENLLKLKGLKFWSISEQASAESEHNMLKKTVVNGSLVESGTVKGKCRGHNRFIRNELYRLETSPLKFLYKERIQALQKTESMLKPKKKESCNPAIMVQVGPNPSPYVKPRSPKICDSKRLGLLVGG